MASRARTRIFPIGELASQNKWWANPKAITEDPSIRAFSQSDFQWEPRLRYMFEFSKDLVYSLRGPRQIGKTTLTKLMVRDLLDQGVPQDHIFYFDCENLSNRQDIVAVVESYVEWVRRRSQNRVHVFLDEVSAIPEWQRGVKFLVDSGTLSLSTVIVTGSHSMDIKASSERLPGRRGQSQAVLDKLMMPVKFSEYVETIDSDIAQAIRDLDLLKQEERRRVFLGLSSRTIPESFDQLLSYAKELNAYLQQYFITGGVPPAINDYMKKGRIEASRYRDYVDAVVGDLRRWNKRENYLRQIVAKIAEVICTPVSWNSIKNATDIPHHQTVAEYVDALKDNYTLIYTYRFDSTKRGPAFEKDKKVYFHDPFIFHALRTWVAGTDPFEGTLGYLDSPQRVSLLAESVVCDHLIRLAFMLSPQRHTFDPTTALFYWRTKNEREIDFVLRVDSTYVPIELTFQNSISSEDLFAIAQFNSIEGSKSGIVLSRDELSVERNTVVVPLSLFLMIV